MSEPIKANELLEITSRLWASTKDIQKIGCVGQARALKIMNDIKNQMSDDNMISPRYLVSMDYVLKYFKIDEQKIKKMLIMGGAIK